MQDKVTLVNEQDQVIGELDKIAAHREEGQLHRAISVFFFRNNPQTKKTELLMQQRSDKKIVGAGQWANTVCGNVWPGESYIDCARRRLGFELGISDKTINLDDIFTFRYQVKCNEKFSENEMDHIFVGWFDGEVSPNPEEVTDWQWVEWHKAKQMEVDLDLAPWFKKMMQTAGLVMKLEEYARL